MLEYLTLDCQKGIMKRASIGRVLVVVLGRKKRSMMMTTKSVSQTKRLRDGFTLIELLVVIAIVTLLLSVLMPALKKAKELGKRAVCLNHTRQLTISWKMYADDYDGLIPQANVGDGSFTEYGWVAAAAGDTPEEQIESIEDGVLFPYTATLNVYHCPTSTRDEPRSYSIVSSMNTTGDTSSSGNVYHKIEDIPMSSDMFVFVCGGTTDKKDEDAFADNAFAVKNDSPVWGNDRPPLRHSNGTVFSYVDGHSESLTWQDKETIDLGKGKLNIATPVRGSLDLQRVQRGMWGSLDYSPEEN